VLRQRETHPTSATTHRPHTGLVTFTERGHSNTNDALIYFPLSETFHSIPPLDQLAKVTIRYRASRVEQWTSLLFTSICLLYTAGLIISMEHDHSCTNDTLKFFPLLETFHSKVPLDHVANSAIRYLASFPSPPFSTTSQREPAALPLLHQYNFAPHSLQCLQRSPPNTPSRPVSSSSSASALDPPSCFPLWASSVSYSSSH